MKPLWLVIAGLISLWGGAPAVATPVCDAPVIVVYFESGSAELTEPALAKLGQAIGQDSSRAACPIANIEVAGHADSAGAPADNLFLSERRAITVRGELVRLGIDDRLIFQTAFGEHNPMVATPDGANEARNRRVEILISPR
jgi:outer membrane protein OmpA-like peptidoglycan-associated protein